MRLSRLTFNVIQKQLRRKVKPRPVQEIAEETRKIRKELWEKNEIMNE